MNEYYSVFVNFHERIIFGIRKFFEQIVFSIWKFYEWIVFDWSGYLYSNIRYSAKNINLFQYIWIFNKLWYIFMNKYYSVFHIRKISWPNTIWYSVFKIFLWTNTIRYSVFGNVSWTNTIRYSVFENFHEQILFGIQYSEILHERIYSVFGIRSNSLFGATLILTFFVKKVIKGFDY